MNLKTIHINNKTQNGNGKPNTVKSSCSWSGRNNNTNNLERALTILAVVGVVVLGAITS